MSSVSNVEVIAVEANVFYVHHTISIGVEAKRVISAIVKSGIGAVPPIVYRRDGTDAVKLVGKFDAIQRVLARLPELLPVEIDHIGDFNSGNELVTSVLSKRQRDAIRAAVELGYYASPREAYLKDIAVTMDCAESTAGEHLRKAETKLLRAIVSGKYRYSARDQFTAQMATPSVRS